MLGDRGTGDGGGGGTGGGRGSGRFFDDLAGMAGGAFSALAGLRAEIESNVRSQTEMVIQRLELVRREELDAALELARRAREEGEGLAARVAALEARLAGMPGEPRWAAAGTAGESGGAVGGDGSRVGASVADEDTLRGSGGASTGPAKPNQGGRGGASEAQTPPAADPGTGGESGGGQS